MEIGDLYDFPHRDLARPSAPLRTLTPGPPPRGRGESSPLPAGEGGRRPGEGYPRFKVTPGAVRVVNETVAAAYERASSKAR